MVGKQKLCSLVAILTSISMAIVAVALMLLYNSAFEQQRMRLIDTVKSQASLIEAMARYDQKATQQLRINNPNYDSFEATLGQLREAHVGFEGLGETGEFTLAKSDGDQIVFLLSHRNDDSDSPLPVAFSSSNAEPMRLALNGKSGTVIGLDYDGETVLAAFEPIEELGLGIVAKIDIAEIRSPFIRAGLISIGVAILFTLIGAVLLYRVGNLFVSDVMAKQQYYLTKAQEIGNVGSWEIDLIDNKIVWTDESYRIFGVPLGTEITYEVFMELIHPEDRDYVDQEWAAAIEGKPYDIEHRILVNNEIKWIREKAEIHYDKNKQVIGAIGVTQDITLNKLAEVQVAENSSRFKNWMRESFIGVLQATSSGDVLDANQALLSMIGYTHEDLVSGNLDWRNLIPPEFIEMDELKMIEASKNGSCAPYEKQLVHKDGTRVSILVGFSQLLDISGEVLVFIVDITERKLAEERLRDSEEKSRIWLENSPVCTKVLDPDFKLQFMSKAGVDALQVDDVTQLYGNPYPFDFYPESFCSVMRKNLQKVKDTGETVRQEASVVDTAGNELWYESTIVAVKDEHGQLESIMVLSIESTERKRATKQIEEFAAFAKNNPDPLLRTDFDGKITLTNPAAQDLFGSDVSGENVLSILSGSEVSFIEAAHGGESVRFEQKLRDELYEFSVIRDEQTRSIYVYGNNITNTKRLEALELRAARLETAGTIAGQVAHDFNNLLAPLMAYPGFIREDLPSDHPSQEFLDKIENAAQKIADINQQLLTLGRRGHYNQSVLNLNKIVDQSVKQVAPLPEKVSLTVDLDSEMKNILGGGSQIHRVITNLLCNAVDALQGIGHIIVKTENYNSDDKNGVYGFVPKGEYVKLTVSDTGCGIPEDAIQKILEPFYTSKVSDKRRGSGLGLSVVNSVVRDHDGYLDVETKTGKGTSFYIYFPVTSKSIDKNAPKEITGGSETILIVDDDDVQRSVSSVLLKSLGYQVSAVESGEKAVEFLRKNKQDLVILDMIMPGGIDGADTYEQIIEFSPEQKAIIVSGYSETIRAQAAQDLGVGAFVKKPLTKRAIAMAVRTELDRERKALAV